MEQNKEYGKGRGRQLIWKIDMKKLYSYQPGEQEKNKIR